MRPRVTAFEILPYKSKPARKRDVISLIRFPMNLQRKGLGEPSNPSHAMHMSPRLTSKRVFVIEFDVELNFFRQILR